MKKLWILKGKRLTRFASQKHEMNNDYLDYNRTIYSQNNNAIKL